MGYKKGKNPFCHENMIQLATKYYFQLSANTLYFS